MGHSKTSVRSATTPRPDKSITTPRNPIHNPSNPNTMARRAPTSSIVRLRRVRMPFPSLKAARVLAANFDNDRYADLTLTFDGNRYMAHKAIVCPQSQVLEVMCRGRWNEAAVGKIDMFAPDRATFERFMSWMYTGDYTSPVKHLGEELLKRKRNAESSDEEEEENEREEMKAEVLETAMDRAQKKREVEEGKAEERRSRRRASSTVSVSKKSRSKKSAVSEGRVVAQTSAPRASNDILFRKPEGSVNNTGEGAAPRDDFNEAVLIETNMLRIADYYQVKELTSDAWTAFLRCCTLWTPESAKHFTATAGFVTANLPPALENPIKQQLVRWVIEHAEELLEEPSFQEALRENDVLAEKVQRKLQRELDGKQYLFDKMMAHGEPIPCAVWHPRKNDVYEAEHMLTKAKRICRSSRDSASTTGKDG
ncbi:MAG: hypothetical protein M1828_006233 [Chrysothrix sp. TS-e1954]|nr:MAG: hypothetical protein M1828_006233 [Chrysothrix sp. TS-e1954]